MTDVVKDQAPASACRLAGGRLEFAAAKDGAKIPIRMVARSADPIVHWYWGRIVHDLDGMKLHKPVLACDYEHYEPIGFLDKFERTAEGLVVEGALVPTSQPADRVKQLVELSDGGVPFESSIYFDDDMLAEWVGDGMVTTVNGRRFEGPGVVIREWYLRGVAVCPYGADMHTSSAFTAERDNRTLSLRLKEPPMPAKLATNPAAAPQQLSDAAAAAPAAPAAPAAEPPAASAAPAAETAGEPPADATPAAGAALSADRAEAKRFVEAFGNQGALWFAEGLSFEEARTRETKELRAQVAELTKKLGAAAPAAAGENKPVSFSASDPAKRTGFASKIRVAVRRA